MNLSSYFRSISNFEQRCTIKDNLMSPHFATNEKKNLAFDGGKTGC